jgi:hypothetical protein
MSNINTDLCKRAIVNLILNSDNIVAKQFGFTSKHQVEIDEFEADAMKVKNWKRFEKVSEQNGLVRRGFDCKPYDDQLRAYTWDNGTDILRVEIVGE